MDVSGKYAEEGKSLNAIDSLQRALEIYDKLDDGKGGTVGWTAFTIGTLYYNRSVDELNMNYGADVEDKDLDKAEFYCRKGLDAVRFLPILKEPEIVKWFYLCRIKLGAILGRQHKFEEAEEQLKIGEILATQIHEENSTVHGDIYMLLGQLYKDQKRFKDAEEYYKKSLKIKKRLYDVDKQHRIQELYFRIGNMCKEQGKFDKAEKWHGKMSFAYQMENNLCVIS